MATAPDASTPVRRARARAAFFAVFALIVASLTAYATWWVVSRYEAQLNGTGAGDGSVEVVVAARDLRAGEILIREDVKLAPRPSGVPLDELFSSVDGVVGKTVGDRMLAGEPIRFQRLTEGGSGLNVDEVIDPGSRAVTIRTSHAAAVGGLLKPGYYVDVIVTIRPETKDLTADWVTETILQGVRVVAVNNAVATGPVVVEQRDEERYEPRDVYVTLEVEPAEAEEVALAATRGLLLLSLRARDDFQMIDPGQPLVTNALLGIPSVVTTAQAKRLERKASVVRRVRPVPTPQAAPPLLPSTEVIRGTGVTIEQYDEQGRRVRSGPVGK